MTAYFITPVYNKENLIGEVIDGIYKSISETMDYKIIFVIDGCTDNSERILREYVSRKTLMDDVVFLYKDNVHEILSLNYALTYIKDNCNPQPDDLIFTIQDDVVLQEDNIDIIFKNLFEAYPDLGYVSMRIGANIHSSSDDVYESDRIESEYGHWKNGAFADYTKVFYNELHIKEIVIRSPTCMLWKRYEELGFYDENLAPCGYDCHDISIRANIAGYKNAVYVMKYSSEIEWGSMRSNSESKYNPRIGEIYERNRKYLAAKHKNYFESKQ